MSVFSVCVLLFLPAWSSPAKTCDHTMVVVLMTFPSIQRDHQQPPTSFTSLLVVSPIASSMCDVNNILMCNWPPHDTNFRPLYTQSHTHTHTHRCAHTYTHTHTQTHTHTHARTYTHTHAHTTHYTNRKATKRMASSD